MGVSGGFPVVRGKSNTPSFRQKIRDPLPGNQGLFVRDIENRLGAKPAFAP
jgi:hypothetical protein